MTTTNILTTTLVLGLAGALATACDVPPEDGGLTAFGHYRAEVNALDFEHAAEGHMIRTAYFEFTPLGYSGPSSCASLAGATVRFNGKPVPVEDSGGWHPAEDSYWGSGREAGCGLVRIAVTLDDATDEPSDGMLEIEGDGQRFVVSVSRLYVRRHMAVRSVGPGLVVFQPRPSFGDRSNAWVRPVNGEGRPLAAETRLVDGDLHVSVPPATTGRYLIDPSIFGRLDIARCEGLADCRAKASLRRYHVLDLP